MRRYDLVIAAALSVALAAPVLAADMPAGGTMKDMKGMSMSGSKPMKAKAKHKMSCYDYAWESQDLKDCLAKQSAPAAKKGM